MASFRLAGNDGDRRPARVIAGVGVTVAAMWAMTIASAPSVVAAPSMPAAPGHAGTASAAPGCTPGPSNDPDYSAVPGDLDGDQVSDPMVGVPTSGSGAVDVRFSRADTQHVNASFFIGLPAAATGDRFGASLLPIPADNTVCSTLLVGAPGVAASTGAVDILRGSNRGFSAAGATQVKGQTVGEQFGSSMVLFGDLFVGAPNRTVNGQAGAGAIDEYRLSGGKAKLVRTITQDTPGIPGSAEAGDHFGSVLASDQADDVPSPGILVGVPAEDVGTKADAGIVELIGLNGPQTGSSTVTLTTSQSWSQDSAGVVGTAEAGDRFGASISAGGDTDGGAFAVSVGVPGEDVGSIKDAGMVENLPTATGGKVVSGAAYTQESAGIPGGSEAGDNFGSAVLRIRCGSTGTSDPSPLEALLIGASGENAAAGRVTVLGLPFNFYKPTCTTYELEEGTHGIPGPAVSGDRFGASLSYFQGALENNDLGRYLGGGFMIAAPHRAVKGIGAAGEAFWFPVQGGVRVLTDSSGAKANEQYGTLPAST
jgi:hypothetical protein